MCKFNSDSTNFLSDSVMNPAFVLTHYLTKKYTHEINNAKYYYTEMINNIENEDASERITEDIHEAAYGLNTLGLPFYASKEMLDKVSSKND